MNRYDRRDMWNDFDAEVAREREATQDAATILGEDAAYSLGCQDRIQGRNMRESFTLHVADQNHYINGYRDMSSDIGQREAFTSHDQHGFLSHDWSR